MTHPPSTRNSNENTIKNTIQFPCPTRTPSPYPPAAISWNIPSIIQSFPSTYPLPYIETINFSLLSLLTRGEKFRHICKKVIMKLKKEKNMSSYCLKLLNLSYSSPFIIELPCLNYKKLVISSHLKLLDFYTDLSFYPFTLFEKTLRQNYK